MTSKPGISVEDLIYYAGLLDGEGYFFICIGSVKRSKLYLRAGIKIAMVDGINLLAKAQEFWGGYIKSRKARSEKHRDTVEWIIDGKALDLFISKIIPHLRLKKQQAEVIQEFRSFVSYNNNVTESVQSYRLHLMEGLKGLHHSIPFVIDQELRKNALKEINTKRFVSAETIRKLSESHKGKYHTGTFKKGQKPWIAGRRMSEEHKRKIGEANKIALKKYYATIKG